MSGAAVIQFISATLATGGPIFSAVSFAQPLPVTLSGGIGGLSVAGTIADGAVGDPNPLVIGGRDPTTGRVFSALVDPATRALQVEVIGGGSGGNVQGTQPSGVIATANPLIVSGIDGTGTIRDLLTDPSGILQVNASLAGGAITANQGAANAGAAASWFVQNPSAALFAATVTQGPGNTANPWTVQGPAASATALSGNPVRVAAAFNGLAPTAASGQAVDLQASSRGVLLTALANGTTGAPLIVATVGDAQGGMSTNYMITQGQVFNGAAWDRVNKPRTAFRLPSSAASNNAANIKTTPGTIFSISGAVTVATTGAYLKFFDTTGAPNPAALTPLYMFALTFTTGIAGVFSFNLPAGGLYFPTGIGVAIVANPADLDNTSIAAGQIVGLNVSLQ
jgi:hypothetical protein